MSKTCKNIILILINFFLFYYTIHLFFYRFKLAIIDCTSSLELDHTYVKAFQRRSAAYMALGMYDEARRDIQDILKLEPNNKQAKLDIEVVNNKTKQVWEIIHICALTNQINYF